jgi:hypothetical protein
MAGTTPSATSEDEDERIKADEEAAARAFDPYRLAAVDSPVSREAMELEDLIGVPLS